LRGREGVNFPEVVGQERKMEKIMKSEATEEMVGFMAPALEAG